MLHIVFDPEFMVLIDENFWPAQELDWNISKKLWDETILHRQHFLSRVTISIDLNIMWLICLQNKEYKIVPDIVRINL